MKNRDVIEKSFKRFEEAYEAMPEGMESTLKHCALIIGILLRAKGHDAVRDFMCGLFKTCPEHGASLCSYSIMIASAMADILHFAEDPDREFPALTEADRKLLDALMGKAHDEAP